MANLVKMWGILGIEIADRFSILSLHYIQDDFSYICVLLVRCAYACDDASGDTHVDSRLTVIRVPPLPLEFSIAFQTLPVEASTI
jgi:hypothetical protein